MKINLILAWSWILAGFLSGMIMGLFFHKEQWLGGYASHKRRLYRLGHISFFGLAIINFIFYLTFSPAPAITLQLQIASWAFIIGALTMPICCAIMAHFPRVYLIFSFPVVSLLAGAILTLLAIVKV